MLSGLNEHALSTFQYLLKSLKIFELQSLNTIITKIVQVLEISYPIKLVTKLVSPRSLKQTLHIVCPNFIHITTIGPQKPDKNTKYFRSRPQHKV